MTLREAELERLVAVVRDEMAAGRRNVPVCLGLSGADTSRLKERLDETADWPIDGYLIASPSYVRPRSAGCWRISRRLPITPPGRSRSTTFPIAPR